MKGRLFCKSINFMNKMHLYDILFYKCQILIKYIAYLTNYANEQSSIDNLNLIIGNVCNIVNNLEYI